MTLAETQPDQIPATIRGYRSPAKPFRGNRDVAGNAIVPLELNSIGLWLKLLFGSVSTYGSGPYTHEFSILDSLDYESGISAVIDKGHPDLTLYYKYNGIGCTTFDVSFGGDGELTGNFGLTGYKETKGTSPYEASPTDWSSVATRFDNFEASALEGGSTIATLETFTISMNNNLDVAYCIGDSGYKSAWCGGIIALTGTLTGIFDGDTLLAKGRAQTETSLQIGCTDGSNSLTFYIDECTLSYNSPPIDTPNGLRLNLTYTAFYDNESAASCMWAHLVNSQASY